MDHHLHHSHPGMVMDLNPMDLMGFMAIFSFSFGASLHCALMCSPLVCSALGDRAKINRLGIFLYNFARVLAYCSVGFCLGSGTEWLSALRPSWGSLLTLFLGVIIIVVALSKFLSLLGFRPHWSFSWSLGKLLPSFLGPLSRLPPPLKDFCFGLLTVFLPCMTLTPALAAAAASGDGVRGFMSMLAFGLGTLPIMMGATYVPLYIKGVLPPRATKLMVVVFLLATGIITIIRA